MTPPYAIITKNKFSYWAARTALLLGLRYLANGNNWARISLSVWPARIAAEDLTIWQFQLRRLRQKMVKIGLPDPVENVRGRGFRLLESIRLNAKAPIR
jgi:hypothetical protein